MKRNPYLEDRDNKNDARANLPTRLNILLGISLLLMIALTVQLAFLTIQQGSDYKAEVNRSDETVEKGNVPRGLFYDSTGRVIAGNKAQTAITFTRGTNISSATMRETAEKLGKYLTVDTSRLSDRSKADFYLADAKQAAAVQKKINKAKKKGETYTGTQLTDLSV
ncbi:MAG: penicillin-binding protein 2, partial [Leuconostoc falkenbergense]